MRILSTVAAAAGIGVFSAAMAEEVPASADQCLKAAFELAQSVEEKQLSDEAYKKLEGLLTTMEGQCDAQQFAEASASAKDIKALLGSP